MTYAVLFQLSVIKSRLYFEGVHVRHAFPNSKHFYTELWSNED